MQSPPHAAEHFHRLLLVDRALLSPYLGVGGGGQAVTQCLSELSAGRVKRLMSLVKQALLLLNPPHAAFSFFLQKRLSTHTHTWRRRGACVCQAITSGSDRAIHGRPCRKVPVRAPLSVLQRRRQPLSGHHRQHGRFFFRRRRPEKFWRIRGCAKAFLGFPL